MKIDIKFSQLLGAMLLFGLAGTSNAITCGSGTGDTTDVMVDTGIAATSCGTGTTTNDTVQNGFALWQVNLDNAGGINTWAFFEKEENDSFKDPVTGIDTNPSGNFHDGNTSSIGFSSSDIGDGFDTGTFSIANAFAPFLIVMKSDQNFYQWYYFDNLSGALTGTWDDSVFNPNSMSHITVYTQAVPVPAAVWLFGSGLLGLVGIARRKKAA